MEFLNTVLVLYSGIIKENLIDIINSHKIYRDVSRIRDESRWLFTRMKATNGSTKEDWQRRKKSVRRRIVSTDRICQVVKKYWYSDSERW